MDQGEVHREARLAWTLIIAHLSLPSISRLSRTSKSFQSMCMESSHLPFRFGSRLMLTIEQDRKALLEISDQNDIWLPSKWALLHALYGHLETTSLAARETHKLHSTTKAPFLKHCRYLAHGTYPSFKYKPGEEPNYDDKERLCSVQIKVPLHSTAPYAGSVLYLECRVVDTSIHWKPVQRVMITCWIPLLVSAGVPTNEPIFKSHIVPDPCQMALQAFFQQARDVQQQQLQLQQQQHGLFTSRNNKESAEQPFRFTAYMYDTGVTPEFAVAFEKLMAQVAPEHQRSAATVLNDIFSVEIRSETDIALSNPLWNGEAQKLDPNHSLWFPLFFPSINMMYEDSLAKMALLDEEFMTRIQLIWKREARVPVCMALFEDAHPSFGDEAYDEMSETSVDYEYEEGEDGDLIEEELVKFDPEVFEAVPWDSQNRVNDGVVDEAYMKFRMNSSGASELDDDNDDPMDEDIQTKNQGNRYNIFCPELAKSMFDHMQTVEVLDGYDYEISITIAFHSPTNEEQFIFRLDSIGSFDLTIQQLNSTLVDSSIGYMLKTFGAQVLDDSDEELLWRRLEYFLVCASWGAYVTVRGKSYLTRWSNCLGSLERVLGMRELVKHPIDGHFSVGTCEEMSGLGRLSMMYEYLDKK
ncbi:hypothetical protein HDU99_007277 [Rhizoclosmatium hyalinum]|nr:hypothetical protein HDU99_007277 [Rhizoclosmatium hyalinum]